MEASGQLHAPGTHWIGGWVGPRAGLDAVENGEEKILAPTIIRVQFLVFPNVILPCDRLIPRPGSPTDCV
jgi:hypothetical protein